MNCPRGAGSELSKWGRFSLFRVYVVRVYVVSASEIDSAGSGESWATVTAVQVTLVGQIEAGVANQ